MSTLLETDRESGKSMSEAAHGHGGRSTAAVESPVADGIYTCPMHPEVEQNHSGDCPKCGMPLELKTAAAGADDAEDAELRDMTTRFRIGAALTLPVFATSQTWPSRDAVPVARSTL